LDELKSIYEQVTEAMKQDEPDAQAVHCYVSAKDNAFYVRDEWLLENPAEIPVVGVWVCDKAPRGTVRT